MAKPKENPLFDEPEFDEKEFLSIERDRAIGIIVIFVIGALSGLLAGYLQLQGLTYLSVLLMLAILVMLNRILKGLRIKVSTRNSHKVINYGMYIFTWLLFWIIVLNPPVNVVSSPQIHGFQVEQTTNNWANLSLTQTGDYQALSGSHAYSIHLTYKYNFTIPSNGLSYVQGGSQVNPSYTFNNGYLNFTLNSVYGDTYQFQLNWISQASSNPKPIGFTMVVG